MKRSFLVWMSSCGIIISTAALGAETVESIWIDPAVCRATQFRLVDCEPEILSFRSNRRFLRLPTVSFLRSKLTGNCRRLRKLDAIVNVDGSRLSHWNFMFEQLPLATPDFNTITVEPQDGFKRIAEFGFDCVVSIEAVLNRPDFASPEALQAHLNGLEQSSQQTLARIDANNALLEFVQVARLIDAALDARSSEVERFSAEELQAIRGGLQSLMQDPDTTSQELTALSLVFVLFSSERPSPGDEDKPLVSSQDRKKIRDVISRVVAADATVIETEIDTLTAQLANLEIEMKEARSCLDDVTCLE